VGVELQGQGPHKNQEVKKRRFFNGGHNAEPDPNTGSLQRDGSIVAGRRKLGKNSNR